LRKIPGSDDRKYEYWRRRRSKKRSRKMKMNQEGGEESEEEGCEGRRGTVGGLTQEEGMEQVVENAFSLLVPSRFLGKPQPQEEGQKEKVDE
jgi:hypothetical protein